jgi:predicted ATPase
LGGIEKNAVEAFFAAVISERPDMSQDECDEMKRLRCTLADASLLNTKNGSWQQKVDLKQIEQSSGKEALLKAVHDAIRQQMENGCTINVTVTAIHKSDLHHGVLPYGGYHVLDCEDLVKGVIQHLRLEGWNASVRSNHLRQDIVVCGTLYLKKLCSPGKFSLERGKFFLWKERVLKSL